MAVTRRLEGGVADYAALIRPTPYKILQSDVFRPAAGVAQISIGE
jgi:hypothetical protein